MKRKIIFLISFLLSLLVVSCSKFEYFAGNKIKGFTDGSLVEAKFDNPTAMDIDDLGNLYVLDQTKSVSYDIGNRAIRKITPEGKVSTVIDFKDKRVNYFKIKNNYLYFSDNDTSIKRFNLNGELKIENVVGGDDEGIGANNRGDINGDFSVARFRSIRSIVIDDNDNLFILDVDSRNSDKYNSKIKKANLKTKKVESIIFQIEGTTAHVDVDFITSSKDPTSLINIVKLDINPKNNHLYVQSTDTFRKDIFEINSKNQIIDIGISASAFGPFTFDKEGNMYVVILATAKLLKITLDDKTEEISDVGGVLNIKKDFDFPETGSAFESNLIIDNNKQILYMSTSENKIYKLKLNK